MIIARLLLALLLISAAPTAAAGQALLLEVEGAIGPATRDYFARGLKRAQAEGAELVILRIDTPGGLAESMREMIADILASSVPVAAFVAPGGARAASAGTYILYASHIAAMAPTTHLGAATPVAIGGGFPGAPTDEGGEKGPGSAERKAINDAVASIRALARLRGRNAEWAEQAVREAASIEAQVALELKVIDLIAADIPQLLAALNGRQIAIEGRTLTLATTGMSVVRIEPDWRTRLLAVITDPNVAYLLLLLGIYGLIFEFSNPGAVLPGVAGAIALVTALFALQVLPVNYAGLALILLGIGLMVAEAFAPSFGALGMGGAIALAIGSLLLIDTGVPGYGIDPWLIFAVVLVSLLFFALALGLLVKARRGPVVSGREQMVGLTAVAVEPFEHEGLVRVHGELWRARSPRPIRQGERLRVIALDGLTLTVESIDDEGG